MECPWKWASNWAWGGVYQVGPMSQPRGYHRCRVTHNSLYLHTLCPFCSQLYSEQLRVISDSSYRRSRVTPGPITEYVRPQRSANQSAGFGLPMSSTNENAEACFLNIMGTS